MHNSTWTKICFADRADPTQRGPGAFCSAGISQRSSGWDQYCNGGCVDLADPLNCGACNVDVSRTLLIALPSLSLQTLNLYLSPTDTCDCADSAYSVPHPATNVWSTPILTPASTLRIVRHRIRHWITQMLSEIVSHQLFTPFLSLRLLYSIRQYVPAPKCNLILKGHLRHVWDCFWFLRIRSYCSLFVVNLHLSCLILPYYVVAFAQQFDRYILKGSPKTWRCGAAGRAASHQIARAMNPRINAHQVRHMAAG